MSTASKIEWTDASWNPVAGCSIVSPGCTQCYAMTLAGRLEAMGQEKYAGTTKKANGKTLWTGKVNLVPEALAIPLGWKRPRRVFVNSMSDLFHEDVPVSFIADVFNVMADARCEGHTFQILTKRAERMQRVIGKELPDYVAEHWPGDMALSTAMETSFWPLPNCWLGVSVEDQKRADERIPLLLQTPAAVRFLSCEPLLGPVHIAERFLCPRCNPLLTPGHPVLRSDDPNSIHWVIVGGESGHEARPMHPNWARSIRDQCQAARVPFFFKQWGEWYPCAFERGHWPESHSRWTFQEDGQQMVRYGKKTSGRLLDGREWNEYPDTS